jgi:NAD(P)H-hydrate epimerase
MRQALNRTEVRELDRQAIQDYGVPGIVLLENAGRGTADLLRGLGVQGRVVICCGRGNNGGDGLVMARHLDLHNIDVRVALFGAPTELEPDAMVNHDIVARSKIPLAVVDRNHFMESQFRRGLDKADWVVDALFGTGLQGTVRPPFNQVIDCINASGKKVLAVDLPSGLDCNTGAPLGPTVRAKHTATFVALKQGFLNPQSKEYTGEVHVLPIGAPRVLLREFLMSKVR